MHNHEFVSRPSGSITCFVCGLSASHDCHDVPNSVTVTDDNPPYLTIMKGVDVHLVALVEWDHALDCYTITTTSQYKRKGDAVLRCADWARRDGLEIR